ncbi:Protein ECT2 [Thelohanellus kitauei]|uniref:Protein ECT2 n=1 Tax=Thelohanellus kitauei TaxID=669202 RepID=A0A0C2J7Z3_THEKT|nr:Protein ECT2 [Thelohanellus kitauei]
MDIALQGTSLVTDESYSFDQNCSSILVVQTNQKPDLIYRIFIIGDLLETNPSLNECILRHLKQNPLVTCCTLNEQEALATYAQPTTTNMDTSETIFILPDFESPLFSALKKLGVRVYGPTGAIDMINRSVDLNSPNIPNVYTFSLSKAIIVFSGFGVAQKKELSYLNRIAHYMGAKVKQELNSSVTHLVSPHVKSSLYDDSVGLGVIPLTPDWLKFCWDQRHDPAFLGTNTMVTKNYFIKPFTGLFLAFHAFSASEIKELEPLVFENGGFITDINSQDVTHVVVNYTGENDFPFPPRENIWVVNIKWFYESVKLQIKRPEATHIVSQIERKKKKIAFDEPASQSLHLPKPVTKTSTMHTFMNNKRRSREKSSIEEDKQNRRYCTFQELLETESNYIEMLNVMIQVFKEEIVKENKSQLDPIMSNEEIKDTFSYIEPIINIHENIFVELKDIFEKWNSKSSLGRVYDKEVPGMIRAYSAYINFFEKTKSLIDHKMRTNHRFHAVIKFCEINPRCQRQAFKDLLIRPVQRLPSVILLYKEILKHTDPVCSDHQQIAETIEKLTYVLNQINEDKKRTSEQLQNMEIFNRIEECPADFLSSKRKFLFSVDCYEFQDNPKSRSSLMTLFIMCDCIEVTYKMVKKSHPIDFALSPLQYTVANKILSLKKMKSFKHAYLIPFKYIDQLIEINDTTTTWKYSFGLKFKSREFDESKTRYYQIVADDPSEKQKSIIDILTKSVTCSKTVMDVSQNKQSPIVSLGRALENLAFKASRRMSRAFSINNSHNGLPRCMSVMSQINPDSMKSVNNLGDTASYTNEFENVSSTNSSQILHSSSNGKKAEKGRKQFSLWRRSIQPSDIQKR